MIKKGETFLTIKVKLYEGIAELGKPDRNGNSRLVRKKSRLTKTFTIIAKDMKFDEKKGTATFFLGPI